MYTMYPLKSHQYVDQTLFLPGPEIFIADCLSHHNHKEDKDKPIRDMDVWVDTLQSMTDIPECMSISHIQQMTAQNEHLQCLKNIITGWQNTKDQLHIDIKPYWSYKDDLAVIDGIVMKGRCIVIPENLKSRPWTNSMFTTWASKKLNYLHMNLCIELI